jgi:hypothetical protein
MRGPGPLITCQSTQLKNCQQVSSAVVHFQRVVFGCRDNQHHAAAVAMQHTKHLVMIAVHLHHGADGGHAIYQYVLKKDYVATFVHLPGDVRRPWRISSTDQPKTGGIQPKW